MLFYTEEKKLKLKLKLIPIPVLFYFVPCYFALNFIQFHPTVFCYSLATKVKIQSLNFGISNTERVLDSQERLTL